MTNIERKSYILKSDFPEINRDVLILFPKQPLFDWVNSIFKDEKIECPESLAHDAGNVYLLPEMDHYSYTIEFLKENFEVFFEKELFEWCTDENDWPKKLTWEITAEEVALIYKYRWSIELTFKKLKQNFQLHFFYSETENGIKTQVWCTLIAHLMLNVFMAISKTKKAFSTVASFSVLANIIIYCFV